VLIALFADIHANRQAFSACLAQARDQGAQRIVLLGDYVGYGADPEWAVTTVMELVDKGAVAVLGNHDSAVANPREQMNLEAQIAIEWTRGVLGASERQFLAGLPLSVRFGDYFFCHAGIRPGVALEAQTADDLMWIRDGFLGDASDFGAVLDLIETAARTIAAQLTELLAGRAPA